MGEYDEADQPDWEQPLSVELRPGVLADTLFASATDVHTGWRTCVDEGWTIHEVAAVDDRSGNHCRLVEQEYNFEDPPDVWWRDWTVELRLGEVYVVAHWQVQVSNPMDLQWAAAESAKAFEFACILIGKRVFRSFAVEHSRPPRATPSTHH